jgi:hypothetical protein
MLIFVFNEKESNKVVQRTSNYENDMKEFKNLIDQEILSDSTRDVRVFYKDKFFSTSTIFTNVMEKYFEIQEKISVNGLWNPLEIYFYKGFFRLDGGTQLHGSIFFKIFFNRDIKFVKTSENSYKVSAGFLGNTVKVRKNLLLGLKNGDVYELRCNNIVEAEILYEKFNSRLEEKLKIPSKNNPVINNKTLSLENKLSEIKDLFDRGILTQEEYQMKRKRIIENH